MELTTVASWMFSESVLTITSVNTEFTRYVLLMMTTTEWWILDFSFFSLASLYIFQLCDVLTETLLHEIDILLLSVLSNWLSLLSFSNWLSLLSFPKWLSLLSFSKWLSLLSFSNWLKLLFFSNCLSLLSFSNWFSSKVIYGTTWFME